MVYPRDYLSEEMTQQPNQLHLQLAQRILSHVRLSGYKAGQHLTETSLQEVLGTSRGPIRAALGHLAKQKFVEKKPNKGFFLVKPPKKQNGANALPAAEDEKIYLSRVLAASGDIESVPFLQKVSQDPDAQVAAEGLKALRELRTRLG